MIPTHRRGVAEVHDSSGRSTSRLSCPFMRGDVGGVRVCQSLSSSVQPSPNTEFLGFVPPRGEGWEHYLLKVNAPLGKEGPSHRGSSSAPSSFLSSDPELHLCCCSFKCTTQVTGTHERPEPEHCPHCRWLPAALEAQDT